MYRGAKEVDCEGVQRVLVDYMDGDLTLPEHLRVDGHVSGCYICKEELDELRALSEVCSVAMRHPAPRNGFSELRRFITVERRTEETVFSSVKARPYEVIRRWAVATTVVLAAAGFMPLKVGVDAVLAPLNDPGYYEIEPSALSSRSLLRPFVEQRQRLDEKLALRDGDFRAVSGQGAIEQGPSQSRDADQPNRDLSRGPDARAELLA